MTDDKSIDMTGRWASGLCGVELLYAVNDARHGITTYVTSDGQEVAVILPSLQTVSGLIESRQNARDRGYRDAYAGNIPNPGYNEDDHRPQVATRILAYFTGYGDGVFSKKTGSLPTIDDRKLRTSD